MNDDNVSVICFAVIIAIILVFAGMVIGAKIESHLGTNVIRAEAVKRGYAQFVIEGDSTTPVFKWIERAGK